MNKPVVIEAKDIAGPVSGSASQAPAPAPVFPPLAESRVVENCYNIADLREAARKRLPRCVFEFFDRGSEDEVALRGNREAFQKVKLRNKVMVDVSKRDASTTLFGKPMAFPMAVAPTGVAGVCWHNGEIELARAAARAGIPFTLATPSVQSIEQVAAVEGGRKWFQLYMWRERDLSHALVKRARDAGFETLLLTADTAVAPVREYNRRNGFSMPFVPNVTALTDMAMHPRWLMSVMGRYWMNGGLPQLAHYPKDGAHGVASAPKPKSVVPNLRGDNLTWEDVHRLREIWKGPILLKGVHLAEDAERALKEGCDGVVISNHGGRNLDTAVSSLDVLPDIVGAIGGKGTIILDSGIRRGGDIVKALAMGADAVLSGRPGLYGTSVAGEAGAYKAFQLLRNEFETVMGFTGCTKVSDIGEKTIWVDK